MNTNEEERISDFSEEESNFFPVEIVKRRMKLRKQRAILLSGQGEGPSNLRRKRAKKKVEPTVETSSKKKKKSFVWKFLKDDKKQPNSLTKICTLCEDRIRTSNNTSNAMFHLMKHHEREYEKAREDITSESSDIEKDNELEEENEEETYATTSNTRQALSKRSERRPSLRTIFKKSQKKNTLYANKSEKKEALDKLLVEMIATDFQPFSIVNDRGFVKFVNRLNPRYVLPSRGTIADTLLPKYYTLAQEKMIQILNTVEYVAITYDSWTAISHHCYLTLTGHFALHNSIARCTLSFIECSDSHTSDEYSRVITENLKTQYPKLKIAACVSDNASNMVATAKKLSVTHLGCFIHSLQLVIRDAFMDNMPTAVKARMMDLSKNPDPNLDVLLESTNDLPATTENGVPESLITLTKLLRKTKLITYKFNASPLYASALRRELKKHKKPYFSLITAVITRWNSIFCMLERLYDAREIVNGIFMKKSDFEMVLTEDEIQCIPDLLALLKPFYDITMNVSREDIPTINLVVPYTTALIKELESQTPKTEIGCEFRRGLVAQAKRRLLIYESSSIARLAAVLDPRMDEHAFYIKQNYNNAINAISNRIKARVRNQNEELAATAVINEDDTSLPSTSDNCTAIPSILRHVISGVKRRKLSMIKNTTTTAEAIIKLNGFLSRTETSPFNTNVMQFWKEHEFRQLGEEAMRILIIPATSASSERDCSAAEYTLNKRRARLSPDKLKQCLFLNRNLKFLDETELPQDTRA